MSSRKGWWTDRSVDGIWKSLSDEQRSSYARSRHGHVGTYINATRQHLPDADRKIVFDAYLRLHISNAASESLILPQLV
jgi:hypothetical protein